MTFCLINIMKIKDIFKVITVPVIFSSLCCLSPLLLFIFGLSTASFAGSLADTLYWEWKWAFRIMGILLFLVFIYFYFRKKGICTIEKAKRDRNKIINFIILTFLIGILMYLFWLYIVLHYIGVYFKLWN